jgi:hypothetical protein
MMKACWGEITRLLTQGRGLPISFLLLFLLLQFHIRIILLKHLTFRVTIFLIKSV